MSMAQVWSIIGLLATAFGTMIVLMYRMMTFGLGSLRTEMVVRFEKVDMRFDQVEGRLDKVETRLDKVETRLDGVETHLGGLAGRLDKVESNMGELDHDVRALNRAVIAGQAAPAT
ncbi:MAG TPA: hypothetical protein VF069_01770 [Streptosporangiaceae bacterium]